MQSPAMNHYMVQYITKYTVCSYPPVPILTQANQRIQKPLIHAKIIIRQSRKKWGERIGESIKQA